MTKQEVLILTGPGSQDHVFLLDGRVLIYSPAPLNEGGASDKSLLGDFR